MKPNNVEPFRTMIFKISLLSLGLVLSGCITTGADPQGQKATPPEVAQPKEKAGSDAPAGEETSETEAEETLPVPSQAEQLAFVRKHSRPGTDFEEAEHRFVGALPDNPEIGTVAEAALAIGLVKTVLHPVSGFDAPSFEETDMTTEGLSEGEPTEAEGPSLAKLTAERGINLADALSENPLLISSGVASQVLRALRAGPNPDDYRSEIIAAISRHAEGWVDIAKTLGLATDVAKETPEPVAPAGDSVGLPPNPADLADDDSVVMEAQAMADRGDFRGAIGLARRVEEDSALFSVAQEKIKEFSDKAVQQLRRKAARAFQSAMPITDSKVRAEYLAKAKEYLEEAIENFPDASHLPTVKDNLRVISRDLERLQSEQEGH